MIFVGVVAVAAGESHRLICREETVFPCLLMRSPILIRIEDVTARNHQRPIDINDLDNSAREFFVPSIWGKHLPARIELFIPELICLVFGLRNQSVIDPDQGANAAPGIVDANAEVYLIAIPSAEMTGKSWPETSLFGSHYGLSIGLSLFQNLLHDDELPDKQAGLYKNDKTQNSSKKNYAVMREPVDREWLWLVGGLCLLGCCTGLGIGWLVTR